MTDEFNFLNEKNAAQPSPTKHKVFTPGMILTIISFMVVILILGIQLFRQNQTQLGAGANAPDFTLTTYDGQTITLSDYRGQVVVVNFWANWCPPCHAEAADLQDIHETYADKGVLMLGINWLDIESDALGFLSRYGITYPNGPDIGETIVRQYNFQAPPETFVIAPDGTIAQTFIGQVSYDMLAQVIERLLSEAL